MLAHSPRIVMDGLVLALDAANPISYDSTENLMTSSQLGNTILNDAGAVTLTTDTTIANPFGAYDGVLKCVHTAQSGGYFRRGQNMSLTAGVTYTFSFFFKNGTVVSPYGQNRLNIGLLASTYSPTFDETGQGLNQNNPVGDGWYRQVFTFTPSYTQTYQVDFNQTVNQTPLGTYYLYGFQLETGSSASTYYPTTATAKTRGSTLIDLSGNGNTGTLTNGPLYSSANGGSIVFDGSNDYATISNNITPGTGDFAVSVWVYKTETTANRYVWDFGANGGTLASGTSQGPGFRYYNPTIGTGSSLYTSGPVHNINTWYNIVISRISGTTYFYSNGSLIVSAADAGNIGSWGTALTIGNYGGGGSYCHQGNISNLLVYKNKGLTAAEIQQNFNSLRGRFGI